MIVVLGPILTYFGIALITGANIRSMWGGPLFSFFGVLLITTYPFQKTADASVTEQTEIRKTLRGCLIAATVMLLALTARNAIVPPIRGEFSRVHFPGKVVSQEVQRRWAEHETSQLSIVGGDMFVAGCASIYSKQKLDVYAGLKPITSPWVSDEEIIQHGGMILWDIDKYGENPPSGWIDRFRNATVLEPFHCHAAGAAKGIGCQRRDDSCSVFSADRQGSRGKIGNLLVIKIFKVAQLATLKVAHSLILVTRRVSEETALVALPLRLANASGFQKNPS